MQYHRESSVLRNWSLTSKLGLQFHDLNAKQKEIVESMVYRVMEGMAPAALEALSKKASVGEIRQGPDPLPVLVVREDVVKA